MIGTKRLSLKGVVGFGRSMIGTKRLSLKGVVGFGRSMIGTKHLSPKGHSRNHVGTTALGRPPNGTDKTPVLAEKHCQSTLSPKEGKNQGRTAQATPSMLRIATPPQRGRRSRAGQPPHP
ncbi:MAG: hypothetical protein FWB93_03540 [Oscillospiraceae bacterium]|nr:hypothetical protein [Oscillospiraceae bacterium]